jgi:hypothetical protein
MSPKSNHLYELIKSKESLQQVDVGWATFKIKIVKGLKSEKTNCWGTCDFDTYEIHIEEKMGDAPARETLLHEICHILLDLGGLGGGDEESEESVSTTNEKLTITMSRAMMMFARLNPELAKELLCLN